MRTRHLPTMLLAAVAVLAAGCGIKASETTVAVDAEEDTVYDSADDTTDAEEAVDEERDADDAAQEESADTDEPDEQEEPEEADGDELLEGLSFESQPVFIEYRLVHERHDLAEQMTIAQDGDRVATSMTAQGMEVASFVEDGRVVATCMDDGSGWMCLEQEMADQMPELDTGADLFIDADEDEIDLEDALVNPVLDEIAGRDAICGSGDDFVQGEGEFCFDLVTGAMLRLDVHSEADGDLLAEAVEVREATDDDLTPPAEPESFGG